MISCGKCAPSWTNNPGRHTNLHSKIERGDKEEATEAYISVRRGDDDEGNKVI